MQGQSEATAYKMQGIVAAAVGISAKIHANKCGQRYPFWLFDLFCGSGYNDKVDCIGSPIAMLREADKSGVAPSMHCVDINAESLARLSTEAEIRPRMGRDVFLYHGDNINFYEHAAAIVQARELTKYARGIALFDPNDSDIALESLRGFSERLPSVDIVINYSGAAVKRANGGGADRDDLDDMLSAANKRHWLIRRPFGRWQWSLLIGRNIEVGDYKSVGFHRLDSETGREIAKVLIHTRTALKDEQVSRQAALSL